MKILTLVSLFALCVSLSFTSCLSDNTEEEQKNITIKTDDNGDLNIKISKDGEVANAFKDVSDAMNKAGESIGNINLNIEDENGKKVEVVNFRALKELLPNRVGGIKRTDSSGQKTGALGFNIATAEGKYQEGNQSININIVDAGGIGLLVKSMADWSTIEVDKESDNGYEKTTTIDGYKAFVKWDGRHQKGQVSVIVKDRFIVNIEGRNVDMDDLEDALEDIDLENIEDLVN